MKFRFFFLAALTFFSVCGAAGQSFLLKSPDGNLSINLSKQENLQLAIACKGTPVLRQMNIALVINSDTLPGKSSVVTGQKTERISRKIEVIIPNKDSRILDECNQLRLDFSDQLSIIFRAYNDGFAYQFISAKVGEITITDELMELSFPKETHSWFPKEETMYSHYERLYLPVAIHKLELNDFCSLPVLFRTGGINILFTEAALQEYPALFLEKSGEDKMKAIFPSYVLEAIPNQQNSPDRNEIITKEADYIAKSSGKREFPWRVFIISDDDRVLVESNLVYQLSRPLAMDETDWIKPGKVAWDWYNANNIFGVDFRSGINTETYKYFIDFAAENGIEYVILDEGWTKSTTEILECNPELNVAELIRYAEGKGVGIILWVLWKPLDENMVEVLDTYASWGAKGIKVDFMQRADQYMVNSYAAIARESAKRKLLVDFHGAFKPAGLRREYPNVLSYEGVKGNENNKWSRDITPEHTVTLPFIRMVAGPMDFTPGSMQNKREYNFTICFDQPETMGTRAHQVAMYVVYESPIQMLCENPSILRREQETVDFIKQIPTTWDETVCLDAAVADYILVARRKGNDWFIGAMTDSTARELKVDYSFLPEGNYTAEIMQDGVNADRWAQDYRMLTTTVNSSSKMSIHLVSGGGWSAILRKQ